MTFKEKIATALIILFLLPFLAVAIFAGLKAVESFEAGDPAQAGALALFTLVFGGASTGVLALLYAGVNKKRGNDARRAQWPDQPWKWREDWAEGYARSTSPGTMLVGWGFVAFWNLVSLPLLYVLPEEVLDKGNTAALIGLLFPMVGIALLVWSIRSTMVLHRWGRSAMHLREVPGVIGGALSGAIEIGRPCDPPEGFHLSLSCIRRSTSGRSVSEEIIYQDQASGVRPLPGGNGAMTAVPVFFSIPDDCTPSDRTSTRDSVLWRLQARAVVPGVDFDATYEVPVFRTGQQETAGPERSPVDTKSAVAPASPTIQLQRTPTGGFEYRFAAGRNPGVAAALSIVTLVWLGVVVLLAISDAPLMFPIVFGLVGLLLLLAVAQQWSGESRITVDGGSLTIRSSILGISTRTSLPCKNVAAIRAKIDFQSGTRAYYAIIVETEIGRQLTGGTGIRNKAEAEWLAGEIGRCVVRTAATVL